MDGLDNNSVFILCDWAMKFLQVKYREKQTDWFGKRGLNWHINWHIIILFLYNSYILEYYLRTPWMHR